MLRLKKTEKVLIKRWLNKICVDDKPNFKAAMRRQINIAVGPDLPHTVPARVNQRKQLFF